MDLTPTPAAVAVISTAVVAVTPTLGALAVISSLVVAKVSMLAHKLRSAWGEEVGRSPGITRWLIRGLRRAAVSDGSLSSVKDILDQSECDSIAVELSLITEGNRH